MTPTCPALELPSPRASRSRSPSPSGSLAARCSRRSWSPTRATTRPRPQRAREQAAAAVQPIVVDLKQGELIVQAGARLTEADLERLGAVGVLEPKSDPVRIGGWFLLAALTVALFLGWVWRFRPAFWHRNNVLFLVSLFLIVTTVALRATSDRPILPFFLPFAAAALLTTILLDAGAAVVLSAIIGVLASVVSGSVELGVYVVLGSLAGVVAVRRGERLQQFVQAAALMACVNVAVIGIFGLLGEHDLTGTLQLIGAGVAAAVGAAVVAVGTFAVLGNVFGFTTSFQLLELANPSQPLLRRLLLETSGTYHHSLMVGNLGERAAEATGADPLLVRVAAYYHDVGKLANPTAFIENQSGGDNLHDELTPQESAAILKAHVAAGIDLAYEYRLPKPHHRVHPAAPRDGHHQLLLREGARRGDGRRRRPTGHARGRGRRGDRRRQPLPPLRAQAAVTGGGHPDARRRRRGLGPVADRAGRAGHPGDGRSDHPRAPR